MGPEHDDAAGRRRRARRPVRGARADPARPSSPIPALGKLLDALEPWLASADPDSDDASLHRALRRDQHKAVNVPTELAAEISGASAHAQQAWMAAREAKDFKVFQPALEHVLELQSRYIACFDGTGEFAHPYDVLLDDYEPGLTTEELRPLFAHAPGRARPARLRRRRGGGGRARVPGALPGRRAAGARRPSCWRAVGYDPEHWRLDPAVHPFARSMAHTDVRITTRWEEDDLAMAVLLLPARVRARALRGPDGPAPLPDDARGGHRARRARVPDRGCGRTWSGARGRSASGSCRCCASTSAAPFEAHGRAGRSTATSTRSGSR